MNDRVSGKRAWRGLSAAVAVAIGVVIGVAACAQPAHGQAAGAQPPVTTPSAAPQPAAVKRERFTPPISPRRAFLYSLVLPGLGQSRLDRGVSGALFASVELAALTMLQRSNNNLREARRYQVDTLPSEFTVNSDGTLTETGTVVGRYDADLIRTRRLHVEDWLAVIAFNHLFGAADAFVAAQLWDVPVQLSAAPYRGGAALVASVRF